MEALRARVRKLIKAELSKAHKGHALVAEGRHKYRKSYSRKHTGRALVAEGRHRSRSLHRGKHQKRTTNGMALKRHSRKSHSRCGSALLRHSSHHSRHSHRIGSAMLAGKFNYHKSGNKYIRHKAKPRGNHSALLQINKIAKELKRDDPHLSHKEAISMASAEYRGETHHARRSKRNTKRPHKYGK